MKNFRELDKRKVSEVEKDILLSWQKMDILDKSTRGDKREYSASESESFS